VLTCQERRQCTSLVLEWRSASSCESKPRRFGAGLVVSAIGAPESKAFDVSGPKRVDGEGAIALVEASKEVGVKRFVMVSSLGTTKFGWPAAALNLFWGVLYWKAQAEAALIKSGVAYTIVRPGGMERPTDDYKETHSTVLAPRDTLFGGQVSRLQVAEVVGACLSAGDGAANKTIEVVAEEGAEARDLFEQLAELEPEISLTEMRERQAKIADVRNRQAQLVAEAEAVEQELAEAEEKKLRAEKAYSAARAEVQDVRKQVRPQFVGLGSEQHTAIVCMCVFACVRACARARVMSRHGWPQGSKATAALRWFVACPPHELQQTIHHTAG
jgi:uncharacterized protein YbjT (DUF2867 family)